MDIWFYSKGRNDKNSMINNINIACAHKTNPKPVPNYEVIYYAIQADKTKNK